MQIINIEQNVNWAPQPNTLSWVVDNNLPETELVTAVFGFIFNNQGHILLTKNSRGWTIPGGHVEIGETLEQALHREIAEETGAEVEIINPFGYEMIEITAPKPNNYPHPYPKSYLVFFLTKLKVLNNFDDSFESEDRKLFTLEEAEQTAWFKENPKFCAKAIYQFNL